VFKIKKITQFCIGTNNDFEQNLKLLFTAVRTTVSFEQNSKIRFTADSITDWENFA
jgi:hypothetical protein